MKGIFMIPEEFRQSLAEKGIELTDHQMNQFAIYYRTLVEWNEKMNLTAITDEKDVYLKHFYDSLTLAFEVDFTQPLSLCDVGSGAGFPSIPLKIAFPELQITIVDSLNKRIKFLDAVIDELGLQEINTIHGRAEDFARQKEYREQFDLVVSRAVANLSSLSEYCLPYAKIGGIFLPYKSGEIDEELQSSMNAIKLLGGELRQVIKFELPGTEIRRSFVYIDKVKQTAKKYPRKAGMPTKEPL